MKKNIFIVVFLIFASIISQAQPPDYNVVFDLTSKDTTDHQAVIRWIKGILASTPNAKLEIVLYGQSLDMVVKNKSVASDDVSKLAGYENISFKVCALAMQRHNIDKTQLLPGVVVVPDGIYEIITRQREGWGYIKAGR